MKTCENCGIDHEGTFGSGRFCSLKCSRGFSTKAKRKEINAQVSLKIKGKLANGEIVGFYKRNFSVEKRTFICEECEKIFEHQGSSKDAKRKKFCSKACQGTRNRKMGIRKLVAEGKWHGWKYSWKEETFAEKFVRLFLEERQIEFQTQYKINRFFADFAFVTKKIILEVDGSQHFTEEHQKRDRIREEFIENEGWKVFRLKFGNVNDQKEKQRILQDLEEFASVV